MTNLIRREARGEPARVRAKPETAEGAEANDKATLGRLTWLRSERREGEAEEAERPVVSGEGGGSQSLHSTDAAQACERGGEQNRPEGREAGSGRRA